MPVAAHSSPSSTPWVSGHVASRSQARPGSVSRERPGRLKAATVRPFAMWTWARCPSNFGSAA
jgi:hypothetical protein